MRKSQAHLKLRQIEVFLEAARLGNFGEAARRLGVSSAALSQAIGDLERDLGEGVVLFERDQRGARLTPAGQVLVEHGNRILGDVDSARRAIAALSSQEATVLKVAYQATVASCAIATFEKLLRGIPQLRIEAVETVSSAIIRKVQRATVEFGVGYVPAILPPDPLTALDAAVAGLPEDIDFIPIITNGLNLACSARHPLARQKHVELTALANEPFALPWFKKETAPGALRLRHAIETYFKEHAFVPQRAVFQGSNTASVIAMVRAGLAVSVVAALDPKERDGVTLIPLPKTPMLATAILIRRGSKLSATAQAFVDDVRGRVLSAGLGITAEPERGT